MRAAIGFPTVGLTADELMLRVLRRVPLESSADVGNVDRLWKHRRGVRTLREALFEAYRVVDVTVAGEPMSVATTFPHVAIITRSQSIAPALDLFQSRLRGMVGDVGTEPSDIRVRPFTSPFLPGNEGYCYFGIGVFVPAGELRTGRILVERLDGTRRCEMVLGHPDQPAGFFQGQTGLAFTVASNAKVAPVYPPNSLFDTAAQKAFDDVVFFLGKLRDDQQLTLERLSASNADEAAFTKRELKYTEGDVIVRSAAGGSEGNNLRNAAVLDTWLTLTAVRAPNAPAARIRFETSLNERPFRPQNQPGPSRSRLRLAIVGFCLPRAKPLTYTTRWWFDFDSDGQPVYSDLLPRRFRLFATAWKGIFWAPYERRDDPRPFIEGVPFGPKGNEFTLRWRERPQNVFLLERQHEEPFGWIELPDDAIGDDIEVTISPTENPRAVSLHWLDTFGMVEDAMGVIDGFGKQYTADFPLNLAVRGDDITISPIQKSDGFTVARATIPVPGGDKRPIPGRSGPQATRPNSAAPGARRKDGAVREHKIGEIFRLGPVMVRIERD